MSTQIRPAPVRKSIFVDAPPEHAFDVFTRGIGKWWPKTHHVGKSELDRPVIDPRAGGRWYHIESDGSECEVGRVQVFDPPLRLVLIWQLRADFTYDPNVLTEVEVQFTPEGAGTRVDLEHRDLERLGDDADKLREAVDSSGGWSGLLALFAEAAAS